MRFYQRFGFTVDGVSGVGFGGGGWRDLVREFDDEKVYSCGSMTPNSRSFMKSLRSTPMIGEH